MRWGSLTALVAVLAICSSPAGAAPVATDDASYTLLGAVFPDPLAGCQNAGSPPCDPKARGNVAAVSHIGFQEFVDGVTYMNQREEWARYMEILVLDGKLGEGSAEKAAIEADPATMAPGNTMRLVEFTPRPEHVSAGLPTSTLDRQKSDLVIVRVTDETVPDDNKKRYTLSLSIHGIERAGAEGGIRAMEELVTSAGTPHGKDPVLPPDARPTSPSFEDVLRRSIIYFTFPNPDGWRRGSFTELQPAFQRYNGNGIDPNRDWADIGYSYRGYSGYSEPETRAFKRFYDDNLAAGRRFAAGDDLHGQPFADALSYTLMPHGRHDLGKDTRIRETVKTINRAQYEATKWSPMIVDNDHPVGGGLPCVETLGDTCARIYAQTWGSVYDTINYTTTGTLGDWFDSSTGLNADGIDNEMSFSHLDRNTVFERHGEQLHVAGNKAIIYGHVADLLEPISGLIDTGGRNAYVPNTRVTRAEARIEAGPPPGTRAQDDLVDVMGVPDPTENGQTTIPFDVQRSETIYSGGMRVDITTPNAQGIGPGAATLAVQCRGCDDHVGASESESAEDWITVGEDYNQSPAYVQAGITVAINRPDAFYTDAAGKQQPVQWRALVSLSGAPIGPVRMDVDFTSEPASADGPTGGDRPSLEVAYDVANTDFFKDLNRYFPERADRFEAIDPRRVIDGQQALSGFRTLFLADELLPGFTGLYKGETLAEGDKPREPGPFGEADKDRWAAKLREYVEGGGNLVLTDAALRGLPELTAIPARAINRQRTYVGQVSWQRCTQVVEDGCDGVESSIKDPLGRNVDQPGARFNSGARRQTYEPTPLGFAIQSETGGDSSNARQYDVEHADFVAAGGRVAATSASDSPRSAQPLTDRVILGEIKLGKGTLRVAGALLPQPSNQFDHPLGIEPYALTYTGYILLCNLIDADCLPTRDGVVDDGPQPGPGGPQPAVACASAAGFKTARVRARGRGLRIVIERAIEAPATVDVFRVADGRRVVRNGRVARFRRRDRSFSWTPRRLRDGVYFVRFHMPVGAQDDDRRFVVVRRDGRFRLRRGHYGNAQCGILRFHKLYSPVFGGTRRTPLRIAYRVAQDARVTVTVTRGKRTVRRFRGRDVAPGRTVRLTLPGRATRRRGDYVVRIRATRAGRTVTRTMVARRL